MQQADQSAESPDVVRRDGLQVRIRATDAGADGFQLCQSEKALRPAGDAEAASGRAAERKARIGGRHDQVVDADGAGIDTRGEGLSGGGWAEDAGPQGIRVGGGQPERLLRAFDGYEGEPRGEDVLAQDGQGRGRVQQDGGAGSAFVMQAGAVRHGLFEQRFEASGDWRRGCGIGDAREEGKKEGFQSFGLGFLDKDPAGSDARCAAIEAEAVSEALRRKPKVRAGEDENGVGAGEFHRAGGERRGGGFEDLRAGLGGAGEEDVVVAGADGARAVVGPQDVEQAGGKAGFGEKGGKGMGGRFSGGGGFKGDGVAGGKGLEDLDAGEEDGIIAGSKDKNDAERFAADFGVDAEQPKRAAPAETARGQQGWRFAFQEAGGFQEGKDLGGQGVGQGAADGGSEGLGPRRDEAAGAADNAEPGFDPGFGPWCGGGAKGGRQRRGDKNVHALKFSRVRQIDEREARIVHGVAREKEIGLQMNKRVGIVGAGPGGLAAAMLLAKAGVDVTVHEAHGQVGGRSSTITAPTEQGTFRFDMGPTFFLYPRVLSDIFMACGRRLEDEVELIRIDPQYHLVFEGGGEIRASGDMEKMAAELARFSPADAAALPRFMADNRAKLEVFRPVLEGAFNGMRDLMRPPVLRGLRKLRPHRSVDQDLGTYFRDERVRLAFSFQSKYLGMSPFRCPSLFTILSFMEYEYGVFHPRGGSGAVMGALARVARDLGAEIRLGEPVEEMLFAGRRATGVRTAEGTREYDAIVINADFAETMTRLVPDRIRRRWTDKRIGTKKFSCSTFMLYLGIEGDIPDLAHHTVYLAEDYRRNLAEIEAGIPPGNPSFYVQNACVTDPALAPPGHSTLYVLVPVGHRVGEGVDWDAEAPRYRKLALERLKRIGIPDIESRIRFEKMLTPRGWEDDLRIYRGATFNLAHNLAQMLHFRPRNRFEDLDGVYLVGGGTHPGSGLPVIFESARITTKLLTEDLGVRADWEAPSAMAAPNYVPAIAEAL